MPYGEIIEKLDELEDLTAAGFPDGSIDTYVKFRSGKEANITDKQEVAGRISQNSSASFRAVPGRTEPGGKSFNMSLQSNKLGLETCHIGFLDHTVFEDLELQTYSLGNPAEVIVAEFENGSLLISQENKSLVNWELKDLKKFKSLEEILSTDVINCANWISVAEMTSELEKIAEEEISAEVFSFDPGNLTDVEPEKIRKMFRALEKISEKCRVIVHANSDEVKKTAKAYNVEGSTREKVNMIQVETGVDGYILHDKERAVAGTREGSVEVENLVTDHIETRTGAGDRFDAGVSAAKASGWSWSESLALGNLCAVHYVENNDTATPEAIRKQVENKL